MLFRRRSHERSYSPGRIIWRRFVRNGTGMAAFGFIVVSAVVALLGYLITPDKTPYANRQMLEVSTLKPGASVEVIKVRNNHKSENRGPFHTMLFGKSAPFTFYPISDHRFSGDSIIISLYDPEPVGPPVAFGFAIAEVLFSAYLSETTADGKIVFTLPDGNQQSIGIENAREIVKSEHIMRQKYLLGTDQFGRDLLSRLLIGTRVSLSVGFISVFISLVIGLSLGSMGGYFRGRLDDFIMWLINVVWSIPTLLMVIAITFALGKGFWQVFVAVGLTMWVEVARVARGQMISLREKEFVEAGRALGYSNFRIIVKHMLPNIISPVIVISAANFASAILIEAGLSFLGLGVQPPVPSWGSMIKENYAFIILDSPYLAILPGLAIMLMVLAFMLVGNALRDAQDVRLSDGK